MNAYTVDPIGPGPPVTAASAPIYIPPNYQYQYTPTREVRTIREWLPWSIINIFLGGIFIGIIPLIFSLLCRSSKRRNDANGAKTMSTLALVFNIIVTVLSIISLIVLIVWLVIFIPRIRKLTDDNANFVYLP